MQDIISFLEKQPGPNHIATVEEVKAATGCTDSELMDLYYEGRVDIIQTKQKGNDFIKLPIEFK